MLNTTPEPATATTPIAAFTACPPRWRDRYTAGRPAARPAVTLQDHIAFLLGRDDDRPREPRHGDPVSGPAVLLETGHVRGVDGDQAELLAAVCEATRGGREPARIGTVARCSGLTGAEIARELGPAIDAGLIGRDSATRRLLPTRHGLQVARLL